MKLWNQNPLFDLCPTLDFFVQVVMTACGHIFHAKCCAESESATFPVQGCWSCPVCRQLVTDVQCSYENIWLDGKPLQKPTREGLALLLKGNPAMKFSVDKLCESLVGSHAGPKDVNSDACMDAHENIRSPACCSGCDSGYAGAVLLPGVRSSVLNMVIKGSHSEPTTTSQDDFPTPSNKKPSAGCVPFNFSLGSMGKFFRV